MKVVPVLVISLACTAFPALAQPGGPLGALQARVDALAAQNASQQQQIDSLQTGLGRLQSSVAALQADVAGLGGDDGTAAALPGTWTGVANTVEFDRSVPLFAPLQGGQRFFNLFAGTPPEVPSGPAPFFPVPLLQGCPNGSGLCQTGAMQVGVNPDFWLARGGTENLSLTVDAFSGRNLTGTVTPQGQPAFPFSGVVLGNNFFFLRVRVTGSVGPCAATGIVIFQGIATLSVDTTPPRRMTFTASGVQADCQHSIIRAGLAKS